MVHCVRRLLLPAALVLLIALVSAGRVSTPTDVRAAYDPNGPAFDELSVFDTGTTPAPVKQPPRLLAGTNSHSLPADAAARNGYCVDVNIDGVTPVQSFTIPSSAFGFLLTASDAIDPNAPASVNVAVPAAGTYVYGGAVGAGAAVLNAATPGSADDVYCVVAYAQPGYKKLKIEWHYTDGSGQQVISLPDIPIVTVTLQKIGDGLVGGPAEVCTVGWDAAFLTGARSNNFLSDNVTARDNNPLTGSPNVYDPVNDVRVEDFVTVPTGGAENVRVEYVRQEGPEWCAGIAADAAVTITDVTFNFHAVYNRTDIGILPTIDKDEDDQPVALQLPAGVTLDIVDSIELRHVTSDGKVPARQRSAPLVTGSTHYVCLIGTDAADTLNASGIHFAPLAGADVPGAGSISVFHKSAANNPRLNGVQDDTLCFSYTSASPGEHTIYVDFLNNGVPDVAFFDTNGDGNGFDGGAAGPLVTQWNRIDRTVITTGGSPTTGAVTFSTLTVPMQFNVGDGTMISGAGFTEWVLGSHSTGGTLYADLPLDGAWIRAQIVGQCGYFDVNDPQDPLPQPTVITGISVGGRFELNAGDGDPFSKPTFSTPAYADEDATPDDIKYSTVNAPGCSANSQVRIQIDVFYPGQTTPATPQEWVDLRFSFIPANKTPRVAWAGEFVTITYAFASTGSCAGQTVQFVRPENQPGSFIPGPGITLDGPNRASADFGAGCSASVRYESEEPGEVDIEVFLTDNPFSKVAFPVFFIIFEDLTIDATPDQFVSSFGDVTADVRGYFVGTNPSGRPAEVKPDGRSVPQDRWILPDDWEKLKGPSGLRQNWGSIDMPAAIITFLMDNETVVNNYRIPVKNGSSGFFIPDDATDFSFNVNPHTKATTALGTLDKPRMMSQPSDGAGSASVDTFGDLNLTYEDCAPNRFNGNPQCKLEDVVGHGLYYAVAEYPEPRTRGKWPAVASNKASTDWRWAGYKEVTIVNTDSPQIKYVVAHLRDRDGFCDSVNYNNTLGVPVKFEIDAGGGTIIAAADRPFDINGTRRFATATSFDTMDALGRPINTDIAKPTIADDECQAWIQVTNSLMKPTNVMVTFPAPPSPVPGEVRITNLQCTGQETITVKNVSDHLVNLAGFGLQSIGSDVGNAEHRDLDGYLEPGESKTFLGGPGAKDNLWLGVSGEVFTGANDFVRLTWDDFIISTVFCDGTVHDNPIPASFLLDGEGEIVIDVTIPFGSETAVELAEGWNLVPTGSATAGIAETIAGLEDDIVVIYAWDADLQEWQRYIPGAPDAVNTIQDFGNNVIVWIQVKRPLTLTLPK